MNFGTALAGYGQAQPQIQQMQDMQRKQSEKADIADALKQYAQRSGGGGQPGQPGAPGQPQGGFAGGMPPLDQMIDMLSKSGMPADQQYEALTQYGAFASPFEKMMSQMEMKQMQIDNAATMTKERLDMMKTLQGMRDSTAMRGQDIRADTAAGAQDIQQQRADTYQQGTQSRVIQGEEGLKIKQQSADTASDRAGTYKYKAMEDVSERKTLDAAKIKKMESSTSAENKKPFQAARDQYNRAAALYQSLTRPGATPAASPDDVTFAKQKMDEAATKMESLAGSGAAAPAPAAKEKIKPGEEVRYDDKGNAFVNRNGQAVPAEK